jgi:amino acid transporter
MVARAFGTYAASLVPGGSASNATVGIIAAGLVVGLTLVNFIGAGVVGKVELAVVAAKLLVLAVFVVGGATGVRSQLLADEFRIVSPGGLLAAVGLAFFAYTGFGVITTTAGDLAHPERELPRALWTAIGLVMVLYLSIAFVTFGSLSVADVVIDKDTALAVAAEPVFGRTGFTVMAIAALLATASAVNAGLYGSANISYVLAKHGELPQNFDRRVWRHAPEGLFITSGLVIALAALLDLSQVAALGSLASLLVYVAVSAGHFRLRAQTGAHVTALVAAVATTVATIIAFIVRLAGSQPLVLGAAALVLAGCFAAEAALQRRRSIRPDSALV